MFVDELKIVRNHFEVSFLGIVVLIGMYSDFYFRCR